MGSSAQDAQDAQALLRLRSGPAQALLGLYSSILRHAQALIKCAHARLRYTHPQLRLKQLLTSRD
jgi:hypothetical protein